MAENVVNSGDVFRVTKERRESGEKGERKNKQIINRLGADDL